jgi:hypothetical protein
MMIDNISPEVVQLYTLLKEYSFDVDAYSTDAVIEGWLQEFDLIWISHAITEALYQGRYKLVSVEQILRLWQRRGHPIRHFNREFETIILGQSLLVYPEVSQPEESKALLPRGLGPDQSVISTPYGNRTTEGCSPVETPSVNFADDATFGGKDLPQPEVSTGIYIGEEKLGAGNLTAWFQSEMPFPNFQGTDGPGPTENHHTGPIRPFVPKREVSGMHQRLKAVVQAGAKY